MKARYQIKITLEPTNVEDYFVAQITTDVTELQDINDAADFVVKRYQKAELRGEYYDNSSAPLSD